MNFSIHNPILPSIKAMNGIKKSLNKLKSNLWEKINTNKNNILQSYEPTINSLIKCLRLDIIETDLTVSFSNKNIEKK